MTDQAHAMQIADRLVALRKKNGISQEALADQLGVSRQAVSKWETGQTLPDTEKLIRLADLYQVSLDELLKKDHPNTVQRNVEASNKHLGNSWEEEAEEEDDEWCAVESQLNESSKAAARFKVNGQSFTKPELAEEIIYTFAVLFYIGWGLIMKNWTIMWIVFPLAYCLTLVFEYRSAK